MYVLSLHFFCVCIVEKLGEPVDGAVIPQVCIKLMNSDPIRWCGTCICTYRGLRVHVRRLRDSARVTKKGLVLNL